MHLKSSNPRTFSYNIIPIPMGPHSLKKISWYVCFFAATLMSGISCSQYEYASPTPGILEIRLRAKNSRQDFMPFGKSTFIFNLKSLDVIRQDGARLDVLPDLNTIRRSNEGDNFNTLDTLSRDSVLVLGKVYAPPGTYVGIDIVAQLLQGFSLVQIVSVVPERPTVIPVIEPVPPPAALNQLPRPGQTLRFTVSEGKVTRVNVMIDLDETLIRRTEYFEGDLQFYVSSIQNF